MAQFWLDQFLMVEYDTMQCCSIAYSQLDLANIEHNNGDDYGDDGQAYDHDLYHDHFRNNWWWVWLFWLYDHNLNHGYGNYFEIDHLEDVDICKDVDRGGENHIDDKIDDNSYVHIDLEGPLGS